MGTSPHTDRTYQNEPQTTERMPRVVAWPRSSADVIGPEQYQKSQKYRENKKHRHFSHVLCEVPTQILAFEDGASSQSAHTYKSESTSYKNRPVGRLGFSYVAGRSETFSEAGTMLLPLSEK